MNWNLPLLHERGILALNGSQIRQIELTLDSRNFRPQPIISKIYASYIGFEQPNNIRPQLNILLNFLVLAIGSIAGNLIIAGYFIYGIPLTITGLVLAYIVFRMDQKEQSFNRKLVDRPLY